MNHLFSAVLLSARNLFASILFLCTCVAWGANVSGFVRDSDGLPLAGAVVHLQGRTDVGSVSDFQGHYSIDLPAGKSVLCCSFVGYASVCRDVVVGGHTTLDFVLQPESEQIEEVTVTSRSTREMLNSPQTGVARIDISDLVKMPAMMGEQDVIKSLVLLPGVQSESDASGGFQVRGGESSQNLVLFDGVTVNNAGHLLGFFSPFNSDILRDATLYKGSMPAQFGGRSASVLDISTINGDMQNFRVDGSVGILASKLALQGPISKGRCSYLLSARRTYLDVFLKLTEDLKGTRLFFYDLNGKLAFRLSDKDFLSFSLFRSSDVLGMDDIMDMDWGNSLASLRWSHQFSDRADLAVTLYHSRYRTRMGMDVGDQQVAGEAEEGTSLTMDYNGRASQSSLCADFRFSPGSVSTAHVGFQASYHDIITTEWSQKFYHDKEQRYGLECAAWVGNDWSLGDVLSASAGLRFSLYSVLGGSPYYVLDANGDILSSSNLSRGSVVCSYRNCEPRVGLNFKLSDHQSVKVAYSRASQNIHSIKSGITSTPVDRITPSSNIVKPEVADQFSLGFAASLPSRDGCFDDAVSLEAELYYKSIDNVLDYREGLSSFSYTEMDRLLLSGDGRSFGFEASAKKNHGKLTGWLSYTLSKTEYRIDGLNNGRWYLSNSDRRHAIRIVAMYSLSNKWDFSAAWTFNSGQAMSLPTAKYSVNDHTVYYYDQKNNYRTPNYHRLDVSANLHLPKRRAWRSEWAFGVYNLYARYNPFMITLSDDKNEPSGTRAKQFSLFAFVPSVAYRFKF